RFDNIVRRLTGARLGRRRTARARSNIVAPRIMSDCNRILPDERSANLLHGRRGVFRREAAPRIRRCASELITAIASALRRNLAPMTPQPEEALSNPKALPQYS